MKKLIVLLILFLVNSIQAQWIQTDQELYKHQTRFLINDFQVNENAGWCDHFNPEIAVQFDGSFIIIWHDFKNTHADIYLQRFNPNSERIGYDILVNDDEGFSNQTDPDIDVNIDGRFVVTWIDKRSGKSEIYAQCFDSGANPLGNNFSVNRGKGELTEYSNPSVAMSDNGNFVITWLENRNGEYGIYVQLYNINGDEVIPVFKVNDQNNSIDQYSTPNIGMDDAGNFIIVWEDLRQNIHRDIFAQRFDTEGNKLGINFKVNDDDNDRFHGSPTVGVFPNGNFLITWIDERNYYYDIYAQRFTNNGIPISNNFMVNDLAGGQQFTPIVCTNSSGKFIITWKDQREGGGFFDIFSQIYSENGTPIGSNMKIQDDENSMYYLTPPTSDMDLFGNFIIAWNDKHIGNYQIYVQKFDISGNRIDSTFQVNTDTGSGHQYNPVIGATDNGRFTIAWEDYRNGNADIYLQSFSDMSEPVGANYLVNDDNSASIQRVPQMGIDSWGNSLIVWQDYRDGINNIYGQRFDLNYQPIGTNFRINENVSGNRATWFPKIAMNSNGNSIIVWLESALGYLNIYAQRYDSNGIKLGENFKVNDEEGFIAGLEHLYENEFSVGIDDANNYVISWIEYRDGQYGISYRLYNSSGISVKDIARVKIDSSTFVHDYSMCMGPNGSFIISWVNWNNQSYDNLYAQMYNSLGEPIGNNFLINNVQGSIYRFSAPTLSMNKNGNFCISWQDNRNGNFDIYCQEYSPDGQSIGANFKINSNDGITDQKNPTIYLTNKNLYAVWEDNRVLRQGWDIFANVFHFEDIPLPVELSFFTIKIIDNKIILSWRTETETNNFRFDIERRSENNEWIKIGFISGNGNVTQPVDYNFADETAIPNQTYFYRLKQIDYDGSFKYSKEIEINFDVPLDFSLKQNYPNPFNPSTTISFSISEKTFVSLKIFDLLGNEVVTIVFEELKEGNYTRQWDAKNISSGIYFYRLQAGDYTQTKKLVLLK